MLINEFKAFLNFKTKKLKGENYHFETLHHVIHVYIPYTLIYCSILKESIILINNKIIILHVPRFIISKLLMYVQ